MDNLVFSVRQKTLYYINSKHSFWNKRITISISLFDHTYTSVRIYLTGRNCLLTTSCTHITRTHKNTKQKINFIFKYKSRNIQFRIFVGNVCDTDFDNSELEYCFTCVCKNKHREHIRNKFTILHTYKLQLNSRWQFYICWSSKLESACDRANSWEFYKYSTS